MALISSPIPNLINGISQQPAEIRLASQAERQVNGLSSVARGLEKRPGTEHKAKLSSTAESDSFIHSIRRDREEEYTMILSRTSGASKTLEIYEIQKKDIDFQYRYSTFQQNNLLIISAKLLFEPKGNIQKLSKILQKSPKSIKNDSFPTYFLKVIKRLL